MITQSEGPFSVSQLPLTTGPQVTTSLPTGQIETSE